MWVSILRRAAFSRKKSVPCHPVLGNAIYAPTSWQAWRIPVEASPSPRTFQVSITNSVEMDPALVSRGYFLPR